MEKENQRLLKALEELQGTRHTSDDTLSYISQECPTYHPSLEDNIQEDQRIHMTDCFTEKTKDMTEDKSECLVENGKMDQGDCKSPKGSLAFTNGQISTLISDTEHQHLHAALENGNCLKSELHEVDEGHQEVGKEHLEKEYWRLRQRVKIQEASLESSSMKLAVLKKENNTMVTKVNCFSEVCIKIKDLEKENQELLQQAATDKKSLTSSREVTIFTLLYS